MKIFESFMLLIWENLLLLIGVIRYWLIRLLKRLIKWCKRRKNNIDEGGEVLIDLIDKNRDNNMFNYERKMLEI